MDWNMKLAIDLVPVPVGCLGMCFYSFSARLDFAINSNQYIIHSPAYNTAFVWNPLTRMTIPLLQFKITIECFIISAVIYALGSFWPLPIWCVFAGQAARRLGGSSCPKETPSSHPTHCTERGRLIGTSSGAPQMMRMRWPHNHVILDQDRGQRQPNGWNKRPKHIS